MARDLIDRQALVEHYDSEEFEGKFVWSKSIVKYIQSLPAEGAWIPCSEKLPDRGEKVLVTTTFGFERVYVAERIGLALSNADAWRTEACDFLKMDRVIAWMPLPEPYRGE